MLLKKCLALLLALALLVPSLAFCESESIPVYQPGDTVEMVFAIAHNPNHAVGATLKLEYDHSVFELIPTNSVKNDAPILSPNLDGFPVGEMITVFFTVLPDAPSGEYEVRIVVEQSGNVDEIEVGGLVFTSCRVTVDGAPVDLAAENEALRKQLEEALKALEEEKARNAQAAEASGAFIPGTYEATALGFGGEIEVKLTVDENVITAIEITGEGETPMLGGAAIPMMQKAYVGQASAEAVDSIAGATVTSNAVKEAVAAALSQAKGEARRTAAPETDFEYYLQGGEAIITNYKGPGGNVVIPETLGGYPVCSIAKAFNKCENVNHVTIPSTVKRIDASAFAQCSALTGVTIPDSVTSIGFSAFANCASLAGIVIPGSVTTIEESTFYNCPSLTSVVIPESVTSIGYMSFAKCSGLVTLTIPGSVTSIGSSAFNACSSLISVNIPDSVKSIGGSAFSECGSLSSVTIPNSVKTIGSYTFYGCASLVSITIPGSVTSVQNYAFSRCSSLTSVTIQNDVKSIDNYAFLGCSRLISVTIPASVKSIGNYAFKECHSSLRIYVEKKSYAEQFCKNNRIDYIAR